MTLYAEPGRPRCWNCVVANQHYTILQSEPPSGRMPALLCVEFAEPWEALARTALFPEDNMVLGEGDGERELGQKRTKTKWQSASARPFFKSGPLSCQKLKGKETGIKHAG